MVEQNVAKILTRGRLPLCSGCATITQEISW